MYALEAAKKAVSNINKKQLNEIAVIRNAPFMLEMTMNAVAILIGKKIKDWKRMKKLMARQDFIQVILKFDTDKITKRHRKKILKYYFSNEDFTFERANKASKVAGSLLLWVKAHVHMSCFLNEGNIISKANTKHIH